MSPPRSGRTPTAPPEPRREGPHAMGRVLEALKRVSEGRPSTPEDSPPRLVLHPEHGGPPGDEAEEGDTIPFIEIGPQRTVEGSPSVLNAPVRGRVGSPSQPGPFPAGDGGEDAKPQAAETVGPSPVVAASLRDAVGSRSDPTTGVAAPAVAPYRDLLHSLLAALPGVRRPTLLFLAPFAEGESAKIVSSLAVAAAGEGRKVIVVDGGTGAEGVAGQLGLPRTPGLRDVLVGEVPLDRALRPTEHEGLRILPAGEATGAGGVRFVAETMRSLMRQLRQRADLLLVAGPSRLAAEEARLLAICDAALLVLPEDQAESPRADEILQVVRERGVGVTGCVLVA
jgi:Mrp family chromosome partitioning ATPase